MDIKELSRRYGLSEQAMRKYLRNNLSELNSDGEHVKRTRQGWKVDSLGVERLDKMRGHETPEILDAVPVQDVLREENSRLLKMVVSLQAEVIRLQNEIIRLQKAVPPPPAKPAEPPAKPKTAVSETFAKRRETSTKPKLIDRLKKIFSRVW